MVFSQFSLSWDSHKANICGGFCALQQNGEFVDMTLAADGHFVKVHQVLMALSSPYLKELITSAPCPHPVIFLNNVSQSTLTLLLEYIYTGEVMVPPGNLTSFMEAAKSLHIRGLESVQSDTRPTHNKTVLTQKDTEDEDISTNRKRKCSEVIEQALSLPTTARKISIKPSAATPIVKKTASTDIERDNDNEYSMDFDTNDSDNLDVSQDADKATDNAVKSTNLQFTVSIRGSLQVILNRFMYNLQSTQSTGIKRWRCIDYRNHRCMAFLITKGNVVLNRGNPHCHSFHDKKILAKIEKNGVYSALYELEAHQEKEKEKQREDQSNISNVEYIPASVSQLPDLSDNSKSNNDKFRVERGWCETYTFLYKVYIMKVKMFNIKTFILVVYVHSIFCKSLSSQNKSNLQDDYEKDPAVNRLREYIRIDTSKSKNYELVVEFWKRLASEIGLPIAIYRPASFPVCIMTWVGKRPDLPSILLNTHSDVVDAYEDLWSYPPFEAVIVDGNLYGRGAQDTKSLAIQHYEAIRRLKLNNITLDRTIHISILPDEEIGGNRGIKEFVKTDFFKRLNVGFALDEGLTSPDNLFFSTYQDRRPWQINMTIYGQGGHGSQVKQNNVIEKLQGLLNSVMTFRSEQQRITNSTPFDWGASTSINVNIIKTGIATNIIPNVMTVVIDMRLATDANVTDIDDMVNSWREAAGPLTKIEYIRRDEVSPATAVDDSNPYWLAIQDAAMELNIKIQPVVCPATSDMLVLRKLGIPALGFAPNVNMAVRMHNNDEYMPIETFLNGISIITTIVHKLGNVAAV
ncbi:uncharacterized protein LOC119834323 [Zerene cesonia]|uniref:uncharacterized protein LOC119834323 n=1 Tax=Zerene cesonia TaxID=33412 RepID=UPI0018E57481|nr:uncharacterized protein LOC119834323 [Zerene cesonia]